MAGSTICHSFRNTVIQEFVLDIEKTVDTSSIVLSSSIQKYYGPAEETVYLKGHLIIMDSSILEISMYVIESPNELSIEKYRLHYRDGAGKLIFRYDNAPHHPELDAYPHHKHTPNKITSSTMPSLKDVLNEISAYIIER